MARNGDSGNHSGNSRARAKAERDMLAAQREAKAVELRMRGYEFAEIAVECGYLLADGTPNRSAAYKAWKRALSEISAPSAEIAREAIVRSHNTARRGLWKDFASGKAYAIEAWVLMEQEESKLFGLYAEKQGQSGPAPTIVISGGMAAAIKGLAPGGGDVSASE